MITQFHREARGGLEHRIRGRATFTPFVEQSFPDQIVKQGTSKETRQDIHPGLALSGDQPHIDTHALIRFRYGLTCFCIDFMYQMPDTLQVVSIYLGQGGA